MDIKQRRSIVAFPSIGASPLHRQQTGVPFETESAYGKKLRMISEKEGEDAQITGGTRSLHRRLLALNLEHSSAFPAQSTVAGTVKRADALIA